MKLAGQWILLAVESGELSSIEGPFVFGKLGYRNQRIRKLVAVDRKTGRHKILTVDLKHLQMTTRIEMIDTSQNNSVHFSLIENDKRVGSFDWSLDSDSITARSLELNSGQRLFSSIGLEVEFSSKGNLVFTDSKTKKKLELPFKEASLKQPFDFSELKSEQTAKQVFAGIKPRRIVLIQNFENASISWFDPNAEPHQTEKVTVAQVERACEKADLTGIIPGFESRGVTQIFPMVALFKKQRNSIFWIENGLISQVVDVAMPSDWERVVACDSGRYVGICWHSTETAEDHYVLVDGEQGIVSAVHVESLESPFSLSGVSDEGELIFFDEAGKIKVSRYAKGWSSKVLSLTAEPAERSDKKMVPASILIEPF